MIPLLVSYFHSLPCERLPIDSRAENALAITNPRNRSGALSSPPVHLNSISAPARTYTCQTEIFLRLLGLSCSCTATAEAWRSRAHSHAVRTTSTLLRGLSGSNVSSRKPTLRENSLFFLPFYSLASTC